MNTSNQEIGQTNTIQYLPEESPTFPIKTEEERRKTSKDLLNEIKKNIEKVATIKAIKTGETVEIANKLRSSLEKTFMSDVENYAIKNQLPIFIKKRLINTGIEVISNICCYSIANKPIAFQILKDTDNENYLIKSRNYYEDSTGEKTAKLERKLKMINEQSEEETIALKQKILLEGDADHSLEGLNEYRNAGVGYLNIGRTLKAENISPFTYEFTRQKDGSVKFDLTITISEKKKSKHAAKEEKTDNNIAIE